MQGETHGELFLCDIENRDFRLVSRLDTPPRSENPRSGDRGYRGVAVDVARSRILVTSATKVLIFDYQFNIIKTLEHPLFRHLHDLTIMRDTCCICATGSDCLVELDLKSDEVQAGYRVLTSEDGIPEVSRIVYPWLWNGQRLSHLNSVYPAKDGVYFSGALSGLLFKLTEQRTLEIVRSIPFGAHNATVSNGVGVTLDTEADRVLIEGKALEIVPLPLIEGYPRYPREKHLRRNAGSQAYFARGMAINDDYIVLGYSPASLCRISRLDYKAECLLNFRNNVSWSISGVAQAPAEISLL